MIYKWPKLLPNGPLDIFDRLKTPNEKVPETLFLGLAGGLRAEKEQEKGRKNNKKTTHRLGLGKKRLKCWILSSGEGGPLIRNIA